MSKAIGAWNWPLNPPCYQVKNKWRCNFFSICAFMACMVTNLSHVDACSKIDLRLISHTNYCPWRIISNYSFTESVHYKIEQLRMNHFVHLRMYLKLLDIFQKWVPSIRKGKDLYHYTSAEFCMGVKLSRWHWGRNVGWGCLRIGCWGEYLGLRGTR